MAELGDRELRDRVCRLEGMFTAQQSRIDSLMASIDEDGRFDPDRYFALIKDNLALANMELEMAKEALAERED